MTFRLKFSGTVIMVLCHSTAQIACGGLSADPTPRGGDDDWEEGGDGDVTHSGGQSTGGQPSTGPTGGGGAVDEPVYCTEGRPATVRITGAPVDGTECLLSIEVLNATGQNDPDVYRGDDCFPQGEVCVCSIWVEGLTGSVTEVRVLDEDGQVNAEYSGPYVPFLPTVSSCVGPPQIQIAYNPPPTDPSERTSCIAQGVEELCALGEGCCSCGCGVVTDTCLQEDICPPHQGPTCGDSNCRAGMICCTAAEATCAASEDDCPATTM